MIARISTIRFLVISCTIICFTLTIMIALALPRNKIFKLSMAGLGNYIYQPVKSSGTNALYAEGNSNITSKDDFLTRFIESNKPANYEPDLSRELQRRLSEASKKKTILVWYNSGMGGRTGPVGRENCGNCWTSKNRSLINDESTAAVVFYYYGISPKSMPPPSTRNPDHMYVFWNKEPTPLMRYVHKRELDFEETVHFNATMTYRRDSDFYNTYRYHWINAAFGSKLTPETILPLKENMSIALVSDCSFTAGARLRMKLLTKIKSLGLNIDTFGKCFPESRQAKKNEKETIKLIRKYKFYFAFENSYRCTDYITEKLYRNSLFAGAVPVVFGPKKSDYVDAAPPGSFIYLEDFKTLRDLVEYLQYLDRNDTAYLAYHKWRTTNRDYSSPGNQRVHPFCQLCRTLYGINVDDMYNPRYNERPIPPFTDSVFRRNVASLKNFLFVNENPMCMERNETLLPPSIDYGLI